MIRSAPNALSMTSANGTNTAAEAFGTASVTSPDSLHTVFGRAASAATAAPHGCNALLAIGGFPA